jgi:hypothetical protein
VGASTSHNPTGFHGCYRDSFTFYLFICSLFNGALGSSDYTASSSRIFCEQLLGKVERKKRYPGIYMKDGKNYDPAETRRGYLKENVRGVTASANLLKLWQICPTSWHALFHSKSAKFTNDIRQAYEFHTHRSPFSESGPNLVLTYREMRYAPQLGRIVRYFEFLGHNAVHVMRKKVKQEVLGRCNRLFSFLTIRTALKQTLPTILLLLRVYSLPSNRAIA